MKNLHEELEQETSEILPEQISSAPLVYPIDVLSRTTNFFHGTLEACFPNSGRPSTWLPDFWDIGGLEDSLHRSHGTFDVRGTVCVVYKADNVHEQPGSALFSSEPQETCTRAFSTTIFGHLISRRAAVTTHQGGAPTTAGAS